MERKNLILIGILVLVVALICVAAYVYTSGGESHNPVNNTTSDTNKTVVDANKTVNTTVVGDNSTRVNETNNTNQTHKVYNPQSDSYVEVIGEKYDQDVNRWYTYNAEGVRYYNTRIN